jgi:hypothetical protein
VYACVTSTGGIILRRIVMNIRNFNKDTSRSCVIDVDSKCHLRNSSVNLYRAGNTLHLVYKILFNEIIAVCYEINTEQTGTLCGQNVEFFNVKDGDTYKNNRALKG